MSYEYETPQSIEEAAEPAIRSVASLKDRIQKSSVAELEIRFGNQEGTGRFEAGVDYEYFTCVQLLFDSFPGFEKIHDWQEVVDYHFLDKNRRPTRSRVSSENAAMRIETVHKANVANRAFAIMQSTNQKFPSHVRLSVSREDAVADDVIPSHAKTSHVRIKHVKKYRKGVWNYEISKVWRVESHSDAMREKERNRTRYEVEVECTDADYFRRNSVEYLGISTLLKALSILSPLCGEKVTIR